MHITYAIIIIMAKWQPVLPENRTFKQEEFTKYAQVSQFIYQADESPILRQVSKTVSINDISSEETQEKIKYLKECLLKYRVISGMGRGIAAPQVAITEAIAIAYTPDHLITIINPEITKESSTLLKYPELCMSTVPVIAFVIRPSWIEFDYFDEKGEKRHWETKDDTQQGKILNRVFQHEIDHLKGILNIDRINSPRDLVFHSDPKFYDNAVFEQITPAFNINP